MKLMITALNSTCSGKSNKSIQKVGKEKTNSPSMPNNFAMFDSNIAMQNKLQIFKKVSFKGYHGDPQPIKKLFWNLTGRDNLYTDNWTNEHTYQVGKKKWVYAPIEEVIKRSPEQTIQSIMTLTNQNKLPENIQSPDFGGSWGRRANYIEINPRIAAKYTNGRATEGLYGAMKLLTAIPPSPDSFANCVILSQLYPTPWGENDGLYDVNLHTSQQISGTLLSEGLFAKMGADEQVKAFNDMAHLMGFKTGFRMPMLAGEIKIQGRNFDWNNPNDRKSYVDACTWGLELGFDAIYFDSAKHTLDKNGMTQNLGDPPEWWQTAQMFHEIRQNARKPEASFIGEKCYNNKSFKDVGFTAGTDWGKADDFSSVLWESKNQEWLDDYAAGPEVSNDNDRGEANFGQRLNRINSCLFGYENVGKKLPSYMQLHDIFPLSPYTNTKDLMDHKKEMWNREGWQECEKHWNGVFNTSSDARKYTEDVYHIFENVIKSKG